MNTFSLYIFQDKSYNTFNPVTPRSPSPILNVQGEVHPESHNIDQITPKELNPATTGMPSPSSARAEPAGIAPTRCLSPSATPSRQEVKCATCGSEVVNQVVDENSSVPLSRRLQQEVKLDDSTQHKVLLVSTAALIQRAAALYIYFVSETQPRKTCL